MKRLIYTATAALAVVFAACSNKTDSANAAETVAEVSATETAAASAEEPAVKVAVDTTGYTTTSTGLKYKVVTEGKGAKPTAADVVKVHYTGKLLSGEVFDSSVERGEPATFPLNRVIAGWTEGVQLMSPGAKYQFIIPAELAYGSTGTPGGPIGPNETLYFEVELLDIQK